MGENKVRVQLKPGVESGRIHTTGFDLVLMPGETAEVTEEQYQRQVLASGLFEPAGAGGGRRADSDEG